MEKKSKHRALVVGHREKVTGFLNSNTLKSYLELDFSASGEDALSVITDSPNTYALIISDQRLPGMNGMDFLGRAKQLAPDAVRLLMTRFSDMDTIKTSVNTGRVHRYILKTKGEKGAAEEIMMGLNQYEIQMEAKREMKKAKLLNRQLHQLDSELIDSTKSLDQAHEEIDQEIMTLEDRIHSLSQDSNEMSEALAKALDTHLSGEEGITTEKLDTLYAHTIKTVFSKLDEMAKRGGFQMPRPGADIDEKE